MSVRSVSEKFEQRSDLEIHHLNYYRGNDPEFLAVLCKPCHNTVFKLTQIAATFERQAQQRINPGEPVVIAQPSLVLPRRVQWELDHPVQHGPPPQSVSRRYVPPPTIGHAPTGGGSTAMGRRSDAFT